MEETKFSELSQEQLNEIRRLEEKIQVTLIAYDVAVSGGHNLHDTAINPS